MKKLLILSLAFVFISSAALADIHHYKDEFNHGVSLAMKKISGLEVYDDDNPKFTVYQFSHGQINNVPASKFIIVDKELLTDEPWLEQVSQMGSYALYPGGADESFGTEQPPNDGSTTSIVYKLDTGMGSIKFFSFSYLTYRDLNIETGKHYGSIWLEISGYRDNGDEWSRSMRVVSNDWVMLQGRWHNVNITEFPTFPADATINELRLIETGIPSVTIGKAYFDCVHMTVEDDRGLTPTIDNVLNIEKEGNYTIHYNYGDKPVTVYVDGIKVNRDPTNGFIGYLYIGQVLEVLVEGEMPSEVIVNDYNPTQSWDLTYENAEVSLHVEDPPMCSDEELQVTYDIGFTEGVVSIECSVTEVEVIKEVEVIVEVEVVKEVIVEVIKYEPLVLNRQQLIEYVITSIKDYTRPEWKKFRKAVYTGWFKHKKQQKKERKQAKRNSKEYQNKAYRNLSGYTCIR